MNLIIEYLLLVFNIFNPNIDNINNWVKDTEWHQTNYGYSYSATNLEISEICKNNQNNYLHLPQVIHGVHEIFVDNQLVFESGNSNFTISSPFYYSPTVRCKLINGKKLSWKVTTYSRFFARFTSYPFVSKNDNYSLFFDLQVNILSASAIFFLSIFSLISFFGKIPHNRLLPVTIGGICLSFYSLMTVNSYLPINFSMLNAHKIADSLLSIGFLFYLYSFISVNLINKLLYKINFVFFLFGNYLVVFGKNGDEVQIGTTIQLPLVFLCLLSIFYRITKFNLKNINIRSYLEASSILVFILAGLNDLIHIFGISNNSFMLFPLGSAFGMFFLGVAVNQDIDKTYKERDELLNTLQDKVKDQTKHLTEALDTVKKSQAELIQSARLASLGTLSAGIAHEINNSINFVNGAVIPLERKVLKFVPENEKEIIIKLFSAIKEGTNLTVEIVRSLRNFTGLNQAKVKDVKLNEIAQSVLTILKSKMSHVEVINNIPIDLTLNCYQVGVNQIFMNLITNALDVLPSIKPTIILNAGYINSEKIFIEISDNGCGMNEETQKRIFDPFFTTKEVGKGTGLGLHIVQKEIDKHNGTIRVISEINKGTKFIIELPINFESNQVLEVA